MDKKGLESLKGLKGNLPPIQKEFKIELLPEEELAERSKVANERKEMAQTFAEQEIQIIGALQHYKKTVLNWEFLSKSDPVRMEIERLQKRLEELVSIDGDLGEGKEFSKLIIEVRLTDEWNPAVKMMNRVENQEKRIWVPSPSEIEEAKKNRNGKWPEGTLFFNDKVYFQKLETPGARLLNKRLREMAKRALDDRITKMDAAGSHNLLGLLPGKGIPGKYYLFSPMPESHTLLEVYDDNKGQPNRKPFMKVRVEDAFMNTSRLMEGKRVFPFWWLEKGRVPQDADLSMEEKKNVGNKINVLRNIIGAWREKSQKVETPTPKAPESTTDTDAPMPAKFDHTITTENGSDEVKVFVKPKKAESAI